MTTVDESSVQGHPVVSHEEWFAARLALLEREKACTREDDELSRLQRSLPWELVTKQYTFDGPGGMETPPASSSSRR